MVCMLVTTCDGDNEAESAHKHEVTPTRPEQSQKRRLSDESDTLPSD